MFAELPDHIILDIFKHLSIPDVVNMLDGTDETFEMGRRYLEMKAVRIVLLDWFLGVGEAHEIQSKVYQKTGISLLIAYFTIDDDIEAAVKRFKNMIMHPPQ